MDTCEYSTSLGALTAVPDRGKQWEWTMILGVITSTLLSQQYCHCPLGSSA